MESNSTCLVSVNQAFGLALSFRSFLTIEMRGPRHGCKKDCTKTLYVENRPSFASGFSRVTHNLAGPVAIGYEFIAIWQASRHVVNDSQKHHHIGLGFNYSTT